MTQHHCYEQLLLGTCDKISDPACKKQAAVQHSVEGFLEEIFTCAEIH